MSRHPSDLHAFALGHLHAEAAATVAAHVDGCARCRREVCRLRQEHQFTLDTLPPVAPSPDARARALAAAGAVMATRPGAPAAAPTVTRAPRAAWWGAALTLVVAVAGVGTAWQRHAAWRATEGDRALVAAWLTRDDVTSWRLPAAAGARSPGTVMVADDGVVLVVMRAPAPIGSTYRAWGIGAAGADALGDVPRTVLRADAEGYDQVVVSLEPRRATASPTDPIGAAPVPPNDP